MRDLFDQLVQDGEAGILQLVADRMQESVQLDFKAKADPSHGDFNDNDKRTLAEALSAFSNSAGGTLIFGVDARKGQDGIDCAQGTTPVAQIDRFLSQAQTLIGQLLMPRHEGITVAAIHSSAQPGAGYLLVHVERSERRPHRSEAKGQKQYYKRAGDSSFAMEHYDIEDAFRRVSVPSLQLEWGLQITATNASRPTGVMLRLSLRNEGLITARFPYLHITDVIGGGPYMSQPDNILLAREPTRFAFGGTSDAVIHPDTYLTVALFAMQADFSVVFDLPYLTQRGSDAIFSAHCSFGCENSRPIEQLLKISVAEFGRRLSG